MDAPELKRVKELEAEDNKLKRMYDDLDNVRVDTWEWMTDDNELRPYDALGKIPPLGGKLNRFCLQRA